MLLSQSDGDRCNRCSAHRRSLNRAINRKTRVTTSHDHTNYRYLSSPEKVARLQELQHKNRASNKQIIRLRDKLKESTVKNGVCLDDATRNDLENIMKEEEQNVLERYPKDSFHHLFWQQQKEALTKHPKGMRWHPLMIRLRFNNNLNLNTNTIT